MADPKNPANPEKAPALKDAPATQKISKEELAELIKKAEEDEKAAAKKKPPPQKK